jgi:hypothetical protein
VVELPVASIDGSDQLLAGAASGSRPEQHIDLVAALQRLSPATGRSSRCDPPSA